VGGERDEPAGPEPVGKEHRQAKGSSPARDGTPSITRMMKVEAGGAHKGIIAQMF
jgi:hypothetical protein